MTIDPPISQALEQANGFALEPHLLVLVLMGSHSHGTYIPPAEPDTVDDIEPRDLGCEAFALPD
jgi:hypothetical protein